MADSWVAVFAVDKRFQTELVAAFANADEAQDWARDYYPYQYLLRSCSPPVVHAVKQPAGNSEPRPGGRV